MSLQQFVGVTSDGKMWHTIRDAVTGNWTAFGDMKAAAGSNPGQLVAIGMGYQ